MNIPTLKEPSISGSSDDNDSEPGLASPASTERRRHTVMPTPGKNMMTNLVAKANAIKVAEGKSKGEDARNSVSNQIGKALMFRMGLQATKHKEDDSDESNKSVKYAQNSADRKNDVLKDGVIVSQSSESNE